MRKKTGRCVVAGLTLVALPKHTTATTDRSGRNLAGQCNGSPQSAVFNRLQTISSRNACCSRGNSMGRSGPIPTTALDSLYDALPSVPNQVYRLREMLERCLTQRYGKGKVSLYFPITTAQLGVQFIETVVALAGTFPLQETAVEPVVPASWNAPLESSVPVHPST